jgi:hypothetical protein
VSHFGTATPIEKLSQRTQRAITVTRGVRLVAEAQREQAIIDAEVAISKRDPAWWACKRMFPKPQGSR